MVWGRDGCRSDSRGARSGSGLPTQPGSLFAILIADALAAVWDDLRAGSIGLLHPGRKLVRTACGLPHIHPDERNDELTRKEEENKKIDGA